MCKYLYIHIVTYCVDIYCVYICIYIVYLYMYLCILRTQLVVIPIQHFKPLQRKCLRYI